MSKSFTLSFIVLTFLFELCYTNQQHYHYGILSDKCYHKIFLQKDLFDFECLKGIFIKALSYFIVFGGLLVKLPQIIKILLNKSTYGISFLALVLETTGCVLVVAYGRHVGHNFRLYGQAFFITIMNVLVTFLFIIYSEKSKLPCFLFLIGIGGATYILQNPELLPSEIYVNAIFIQMAFFISSRMSQIIEIFKNKSTGNLALVTFLLNFCGNIARVTTIIVDAGKDWKYLMQVSSAAFLNGFILVQFLIFWNRSTQPDKKQKSV